jgi:hypothetical protein
VDEYSPHGLGWDGKDDHVAGREEVGVWDLGTQCAQVVGEHMVYQYAAGISVRSLRAELPYTVLGGRPPTEQ